ncbi:hypothetical protein [Paraburkholderia unamae]|uniref:hypothetical protein n=1 Tax=Paraburkholderia unamae TaxID=219649 RepID=UPI0011BE0412|nr:hypothetical protein [Paraburkholderia unamae]
MHRWASETPWNSRGGMIVIAVRGKADVKSVFTSIEEEVLRYSQGQPITCVKISLSEESLSLKEFIGERIGWKEEKGSHSFRERVRIHHVDLGASIYFVETDSTEDISEAENWIDLFSKAGGSTPVCFVIVCTEAVAQGAERIVSFTSGGLAERLLSTADDRDEQHFWNEYVVQRLVWESGGSPGIFEVMERTFVDLRDLNRNEATLERALAAASRNLHSQHQSSVANLIDNFSSINGRGRGDRDSLVARDLELQGMLWRPREVAGWILPGWVARSIAPQKALTDPWLLRRSLSCASLAGEIVALCTGLELKIRQQYLRNMEISYVPKDAEEKLNEWVAGRGDEFVRYSSIISLRCGENAGGWNDAWAFADLGELEYALQRSTSAKLSAPVLRALNTLRRVRNSIAHGHPVCWNHVRELRSITDMV